MGGGSGGEATEEGGRCGDRRTEKQAIRQRTAENGVVSSDWWIFRARGTKAIS